MPPSKLDRPDVSGLTTVEIEKLVYGGDGLARVDGQVILTPFVLPGERVQVFSTRAKSGLLRGSNPEIVQASPDRVVPPCEYFGSCGGCQYQHGSYAVQLEQKEAILRETLQRLGGISYEDEIAVLSAEPWHYRNRIQLHFADGRAGFHRAGTNALRPIDHCHIASPVLVDAIQEIASAVRAPQWPSFLRSLELFTNEQQLQLTVLESQRPVAARFFEWCSTFLPNTVPGALNYAAAGHTFRISRGSFFQVNRFLVDALAAEVLRDYTGARAIDLYAGAGLFALPLAQRFEHVDAIERSAPAYRDLEHNASSSPNLQARKGSAEQFLVEIATRPDLLIADPPRAGLGSDAVQALIEAAPARLVLVSCDPATMSRDLKTLLPHYAIERLTLVDLFPQTYHFESVVHLTHR